MRADQMVAKSLATMVMAGVLAIAAVAPAQLVIATSGGNNTSSVTLPTAIPSELSTTVVSASNLFSGVTSTVSDLNDGSMDADGVWIVGIQPTSTITYTFAAPWNLTEIATYAGWSGGAQSNQGYAVTLTYADNSSAVLLPATTLVPASSASLAWTEAELTNSGGGVLSNGGIVANDVIAVTFNNFDASNTGTPYVVNYREIDIVGVAPPAGAITWNNGAGTALWSESGNWTSGASSNGAH